MPCRSNNANHTPKAIFHEKTKENAQQIPFTMSADIKKSAPMYNATARNNFSITMTPF
jgi:hypothetical protein